MRVGRERGGRTREEVGRERREEGKERMVGEAERKEGEVEREGMEVEWKRQGGRGGIEEERTGTERGKGEIVGRKRE